VSWNKNIVKKKSSKNAKLKTAKAFSKSKLSLSVCLRLPDYQHFYQEKFSM